MTFRGGMGRQGRLREPGTASEAGTARKAGSREAIGKLGSARRLGGVESMEGLKAKGRPRRSRLGWDSERGQGKAMGRPWRPWEGKEGWERRGEHGRLREGQGKAKEAMGRQGRLGGWEAKGRLGRLREGQGIPPGGFFTPHRGESRYRHVNTPPRRWQTPWEPMGIQEACVPPGAGRIPPFSS